MMQCQVSLLAQAASVQDGRNMMTCNSTQLKDAMECQQVLDGDKKKFAVAATTSCLISASNILHQRYELSKSSLQEAFASYAPHVCCVSVANAAWTCAWHADCVNHEPQKRH